MTVLRVKATQPGYYGHVRRDPGTELGTFVLKDEAEFADVWMEPVGWEPGKVEKAEPEAEKPAARDPLDHDGDGKKGGTAPKKAEPVRASLETVVTPAQPVKATEGQDI